MNSIGNILKFANLQMLKNILNRDIMHFYKNSIVSKQHAVLGI